jgi:hypothetical protein
MHIQLIASIRQANIYRSIGDERVIEKRWRMVDCIPQFVESILQSAEHRIGKAMEFEKVLCCRLGDVWTSGT